MATHEYKKVLYAGLQSAYNALATKDQDILYFCTDTGKLYKGDIDFSKYCEAVAERPATPAVARLYTIAATGTTEFYDGSAWHVVSNKVVNSFDDESTSSSEVPTTAAVAAYVAEIIGGSSDVVKSVTIANDATAGQITVTQADDTSNVITVPLVGKTLSAGTGAGQIKLAHTTGSDDEVTVPLVVKTISAATGTQNAGKLAVATTTGTHADVTVPGVFVAVDPAAGTGNAAKVTFTDSDGTTADVEVPGVFTDASWNSTSRVLSFTVSGTSTAKTIDLGKDIFIDQSANNRYENGNIYLYLNDGTQSSSPTEIVIPVSGLIVDYVGNDTDSVALSVDNTTHQVTADVVLRQDVAGASGFTNALKLSSDTAAVGGKGLYVDLSDVETDLGNIATAIQWGTF